MPGTFDFTGIRNTALGLIAKFGRDCVLLRNTDAAAVDPSKPWRVTDDPDVAEMPFVGPVFFLKLRPTSTSGDDQTECNIYVPGDLGIEPTTTDRIRIIGILNGETNPEFRVLHVERTEPATNQPIVFVCRCSAWPADGI